MLPKSLGLRLTILLAGVLALFAVLLAFLIANSQSTQLLRETTLSTLRLGSTVKKSTRFDMLNNQRDDVHEIIENIGKQEGIEHVRIFNKEGEIIYSSDEGEMGTVIDKKAEACYQCHDSEKPLTKLDMEKGSRVFKAEDGHRILAAIDVIYNEPACWRAPCHVHPKTQSVLGVLDIGISLEEMDRRLGATTRNTIIYGLLSVLLVCALVWLFVQRFVSRPVRELVEGTKRIASGELDFTTVVDASDEIGFLATSFNRMTHKLKKTQAELSEQTKAALKTEKLAAIGEAITGVAHCVKNMLNGLQGGFYVLETDIKKKHGEIPERGFQMLDRNLKRLSDFVKDMLTYSKDRKPEYEYTDLNELVGCVVDLMQANAKDRNIQLCFYQDDELADVEIDCKGIYRCVLNLVSNALEACEEEGAAVDVSARAEGSDQVLIEVKDEGIGMDQDTRKSIFQLFFSNKGSEGTGLGLSVTRKIIQEHDGRIEVESEPGKGSTFRVYLPVRRMENKDEKRGDKSKCCD